MKKIILALFVFLSLNSFIFSDDEIINPKTGFPEITDKPFVVCNGGVSLAQLTRIEKQTERSNFVRENYLAGAYLEMQTENMKPVNSIIKISAFYPFYNTLNGMQQNSKQVILYAFDLFAGPIFQADMWNYVHINFATGLHYMYQLTDEYHMNYLGLGFAAGLGLPIASRLTFLVNGFLSADYPNFGTNKTVQPFDIAWQYRVDLGLRYSKKKTNKYSYIRSRK